MTFPMEFGSLLHEGFVSKNEINSYFEDLILQETDPSIKRSRIDIVKATFAEIRQCLTSPLTEIEANTSNLTFLQRAYILLESNSMFEPLLSLENPRAEIAKQDFLTRFSLTMLAKPSQRDIDKLEPHELASVYKDRIRGVLHILEVIEGCLNTLLTLH